MKFCCIVFITSLFDCYPAATVGIFFLCMRFDQYR